jgi:ADP-ribose pyrophosphatase
MENDTTSDWKKLNSEVVYDNPWIRVFHENVINPNGGQSIYGRIHFKNVAIGILPIDDEGNTWLVGQSRYPLGTYTWEIPEGGAPIGEDPLKAAMRELAEEVNLQAEHWQLIQEADLSNSATDERMMIYLATGLSRCKGKPDDSERLVVKKVPLETFLNMVDTGEIRDSLSVFAALRYRVMQGK